jgi:uncharacterized protein YjbI with pentapeptide repeats
MLLLPSLKELTMSLRRKFAVLVELTSEEDVFDRLLPVRDVKTGEQGTLLCSHCCQWPEELIPQATWLEGCFTPEAYRDDPRLALGYHPKSVTRWKHREGVLTLSAQKEEELEAFEARQTREEARRQEEIMDQAAWVGPRADLTGADLRGADLRGADLQGANLQGANLRGADLWGADLRGADLQWADLQGAYLVGANLQGADLRGASLQGAEAWEANLTGADLGGANLQGARVMRADLRGADLGGADLAGADLYGANLWGANLTGADLGGANLQRAKGALLP